VHAIRRGMDLVGHVWSKIGGELGGEDDVNKQSKTVTRGRDSSTGQFVPVSEARRRPATTQVERVPKPGFGDTKPNKK
jgi:hypothetical protein